MIDIFNPEVSQIVKGLKAKLLTIYGAPKSGKTSNCVQANKAVVLRFEQGLGALNGVRNFPIDKWTDWTKFVRDVTNPANATKVHEMYETIIIDTIDRMLSLGEEYTCNLYGVSAINRDESGKRGFGIWTEYRAEVQKWIVKLTNAGFTVIFIGHDDTKTLKDDRGEEYTKILPRGDKKNIDFILDMCDIIGYAQPQPFDENGNEVLSTLFLKGSKAITAGSRFKYLPESIPEWNIHKLEDALVEAMQKEEEESGMKGITFEESEKKEQKKAAEEKKNQLSIVDLINTIGNKVKAMMAKDGNKDAYDAILENELGNKDFKASAATEKQREQLELVLNSLTEKGY